MVGAERTAAAQRNARVRADGAEVPPRRGRLIAASAAEAVNATERELCGDGAVYGPAIAEGLAISGRRAATLLEPHEGPDGSAPPATAAVPWVDHRIRLADGESPTGAAFELLAADAQEAVDHCVVAHHLASELERPGLCTIDRETAESLALVRIPDRETAGLPRSMVSTLSVEPAFGPAVPAARTAEAAERILADVSKRLGRRCGAVKTHNAADARLMLVADGSRFRRAVALADALRESGVACGVVGVALVRPFPAVGVREAVAAAECVAVVQSAALGDSPGSLCLSVRAALGDDRRELYRWPLGDDGESRLPADLAEAVGLSPDTPISLTRPEKPAGPRTVLSIAFAPGGSYGEGVLLDLATLLGNLGEIGLGRPSTRTTRSARLVLSDRPGRQVDATRVDLLFVAHPSAPGVLDDTRDLEALDESSSLILFTAGQSPQSAWQALSEPQQRMVEARRPKLYWLSSASLALDASTSLEAAHWALKGALIAASPATAELTGRPGDTIDALAALGDPVGPSEQQSAWLRRGAQALRPIDLASISGDKEQDEHTFRPGADLPRMPAPVEEIPQETRDRWRLALRHFHLTGEGALSAADPIDAVPLRPTVLSAVTRACDPWHRYPLAFLEGQNTEAIVPLRKLLDGALETLSAGGSAPAMLQRFVPAIVRSAERVLELSSGRRPLGEALGRALERLEDEVDVSKAGAQALAGEVGRLKGALPSFGSLVALDRHTLPGIFLETTTTGRQGRRESFRREVADLLDRLEGLLRLDDSHSPQGRSADALKATLATGDDFLDPAALSKNLPSHHGSKRMPAERRARIEAARSTLRTWLERSSDAPEVVLVRAPSPAVADVPTRCRVVEHTDGLEAAIGLFDGLAGGVVDVVRAVRVARLEAGNSYDPELHDRVIDRVGWESFTAEEMFLIPAVVVLETGQRLRGASLSSLSVLLRSGRPVHVLVAETAVERSRRESNDASTGYHPGLGYLAVAHREAFVLQSTLARPRHLISGLQRMASMLNPAVALVAEPSWESPVSPWLQLVAAQQSRVTPCFVYDPLAGQTWAERFDLEDNPQPELAWPTHDVSFLDASGVEQKRQEAFTVAHAAAVDPAFGSHFRVIPTEAWDEEQVEIASYLAAPPNEQRRQVPFLWIVTESGELARAVLTRELAFACRDRMRAWRILQELAGLHNEYARRAAELASEQARAEAARTIEEIEAAHAQQLEAVRREAAGEAMDRLVAVLMDLDSVPAPSARPAAAAHPAVETVSAPAETAAPETPAAVEEVEEEEELSFDDPYINSVLCTTCNECINLNPRMFAYNENRQAVIADAAAGTFEQLVKAAEKCPARCIHPGAPRDGDDTVTDELIARAKPFS